MGRDKQAPGVRAESHSASEDYVGRAQKLQVGDAGQRTAGRKISDRLSKVAKQHGAKMDKNLEVQLTQTFERKPLVYLRNLPGEGAYLTPAQLRRLAAALIQAADESEAQPMGKRSFFVRSREYSLVSDDESGISAQRG